ncbi:MAG TPA: hypothetical protein VFL91_30605 [Thermomicrobiales bacterium]|nr:hypothetical protein [Thermomicrobiales bacterium]
MLQFAGALHTLYAADAGPEREGQGLVEYALILAFIALLVIVGLVFFGGQLQVIYSRIANSMPTN